MAIIPMLSMATMIPATIPKLERGKRGWLGFYQRKKGIAPLTFIPCVIVHYTSRDWHHPICNQDYHDKVRTKDSLSHTDSISLPLTHLREPLMRNIIMRRKLVSSMYIG